MSALKALAASSASVVLVLLTTGAGDPGVRPGTAQGGELVKTGWWWAANETPLDETVVAPPQPSSPNVPKGALPVSAAGGEPEKLSALDFKVDAEPGGFAERAVLVLRENTDPGATVNAEGAKILACPITENFWADGAAGSWRARPGYDCDLASASGERDAKTGTWTFDLTAVAALWTLEDQSGSTGVVLVEGVEAPEAFQVAFDGPAADGVGFAFAFAPPTDTPLLGEGAGTGTAGSSGGVSTGGTSGGLSGGSAGSSLGSAGPLAGSAEVAPAPAAEAVAAPAEQVAVAPASAPVALPAWYSGIPTLGYVLLPLMLGLAYLLMLALGPDAQPAAGPAQRGVGRALERLRAAGAAVTTRGKN